MIRIPFHLAYAAPPAVAAQGGSSPLWGQSSTLHLLGGDIMSDCVDSVSAGTQEERVGFAHMSGGTWTIGQGPLPDRLRGAAMTARALANPKQPQPYFTDVRRGDPTYARPAFALLYRDPHAIENFFNHPGGMRGHFFVSPDDGDFYARELITKLMPLLLAVQRDWRESRPFSGTWLEQDEAILRASLLAGKVWLTEPYRSAGTLADHHWGNGRWENRRTRRALVARRGFIAAVQQAEGDAARAAAFLASGTNGEGMLGPDENIDPSKADLWRVQDEGAEFMGGGAMYALEIKGAFMNAQGQVWAPLRKTYNSLSLHWFGCS